MSDFYPKRDRFADAMAYKTWQSTNQDVERFIASDTGAKMRAFLESAPAMFSAGDNLALPTNVDLTSAMTAREMLQLALLAREAAKDEEAPLTEDDLEEFGLRTVKPSEELKEFLRERAQMIEEVADLATESDSEKSFYSREVGYTCALDPDADIIGISFDVYVPKGLYTSFLMRMLQINDLATEARGIANHWSSGWCIVDEEGDGDPKPSTEKKATHLRLICAMGYYEDSDSGIRHALTNLCDMLMTLHMGDVRTIVIDGQEVRSIATGIGSLWWSALDAMRIGRLGACEVCGRPFITNNERGKKRKYCSEACKQWRKVHPGETRMNKKADSA